MTFQNTTSIFNCTHEESLALWDYLMFLRVKSMLRQPPLPAITKEDMEFEKARAVHLMTQQWYDDMAAIAVGNKAPGDTAPTQAEWVAKVKADIEVAKELQEAKHNAILTGQNFDPGPEPPYPPKTKAEYLEKKRREEGMKRKIESWRNCFVGMSKVEAAYSFRPVDLQMILCDKCHEELYFGRVKDGTDIVCHQCGTMTKFQYEDGKE